ncbi:MAG: DUF932 domain-containing protein [Candidatus Aegiribacteria sp.]|nr:DUF932 domain-containing protein [Candidatus Aegiribacteria sp.]
MTSRLKPPSLPRTVKVSDPYAAVRLAPVSVNGESVSQVGVEILDDQEHWQCLNIHSQGYQLISNSIVQQTAREITSLSNLNWTEEKTIWTGRFLSILYRSNKIVDIPEVGDAVALGFRATNSYDGSAKFRLDLMAFVLSCSNGLMSPRYFSTYTLKHIAVHEFDLNEAVSVLNVGLDTLEKIAPRIVTLSTIPLNLKMLAKVANKVNLPNRDWAYIVQHLEDAHSLWDLFQLSTHQISHNGRGRALINTSEKVGDFFLGNLVDRITA